MPLNIPLPASAPIHLDRSRVAQTYVLFGLAMVLTVIGTIVSLFLAEQIVLWIIPLMFAELVIILTARLWVRTSPLNYLLFALFPVLSGISIGPIIITILNQYVNGASIVLNTIVSTTLLTFGAALFAQRSHWHLEGLGHFLMLSLIGLIFFGILQIFFPSLRSGGAEFLLSGAGIVIFSLFLTFDLKRVHRLAVGGASPFLLALSLYLDIFNLFLYVLRFVAVMGGRRR